MLDRRRVGQGAERALRSHQRFAGGAKHRLKVRLPLLEARNAAPQSARAKRPRHRSPAPLRARRAPLTARQSALPRPSRRHSSIRLSTRSRSATADATLLRCQAIPRPARQAGSRAAIARPRRRRSRGDKPVPPPQPPVARDQPLPDRQRLTFVLIGHRDLLQAAQQLLRRACMIGEAFAPRRQRRIASKHVAALPAARGIAADRRIGILAERRRQARVRTRARREGSRSPHHRHVRARGRAHRARTWPPTNPRARWRGDFPLRRAPRPLRRVPARRRLGGLRPRRGLACRCGLGLCVIARPNCSLPSPSACNCSASFSRSARCGRAAPLQPRAQPRRPVARRASPPAARAARQAQPPLPATPFRRC